MPLEFKRSWGDEEVERFRDSWVRVSKARWCTTRWRSAPARVCRARVVAAGRRTRLPVRRHPRGMGRRRRRFPPRGGAARGDGASRAERHEHRGTSIAAHYLLNHGTDDQKRRYLPRLAQGDGRRDRDDRTWRRIGSPGHTHARRARRQPICNQWVKDLPFQRLSCRAGGRRVQDRSR
jgi:hypothetical protein